MSDSVQHILVVGGGVIGGVYASWLAEVGHQVTVLARGQRLIDLRTHGLTTMDMGTGKRTTSRVATCDHLAPDDRYDLMIVAVRLDQVAHVLPMIGAHIAIPRVLFLLNNAFGAEQFSAAIGGNRAILGFPGVGGRRDDGVVKYYVLRQQPTTLGEVSGQITSRLRQLADLFKSTGHVVTLTAHMDGWLKTHAVFVACVTAAIDQAGGDSVRLAQNSTQVATMVRAVREGFAALDRLGIQVVPGNLAILFGWMPSWFAKLYWQQALKGPLGTLALAPHARAARQEMATVATQVLTLLESQSKFTPTLRQLLGSLIGMPNGDTQAGADTSPTRALPQLE